MAISTIDCKSLVELKLIDSKQPEWTHRCLSICLCVRESESNLMWIFARISFPFWAQFWKQRRWQQHSHSDTQHSERLSYTSWYIDVYWIVFLVSRRIYRDSIIDVQSAWLLLLCTNSDAFATLLATNLCPCYTYLLLLFPFFYFN